MTDHGTNISWTHMPGYTGETWNPTTGCSRVSDGCQSCYAEELSLRRGWSQKPWTPENAEENVVLHPERVWYPHSWRKPRMVFTNSMSDLFHPRVPYDFICDVWRSMAENPRHLFLTLTKRPKRMATWTTRFSETKGIAPEAVWPSHMWVGTSIESREFVSRADVLRGVPAAVRFVSAEPLIGPLISRRRVYWAGGQAEWPDGYFGHELRLDGISWLIAGGESGPKFRPMDLDWVTDLRDACGASGTAFFMKQDSGLRPGKQGRIPDDLWVHEWPQVQEATPSETLF